MIDAGTDAGASDVQVELWNVAGDFLNSTVTDALGDYAFDGLPSGTYYANTDSSDYADELYDDLPCPGGAPSGCDPTTGTPIVAAINDVTSGIDFVLDRFGEITGTVTEAVTGLPLPSIEIELWSASGSYVDNDYTDSLGKYSIAGLSTGTYFAVAEDYEYADELYDDLPCAGGAPYGCDPTAGTPIAVTINDTTGGIDFVLDRLGSISGTVTEVGTSEPIVSLRVEVWSSSGSYVRSANTDSAGAYTVDRLNAGTYFLTTDDDRYVNELYDDLPCGTQGCDPTTGVPVLAVLNADTSGIDFALVERGSISGTVTDQATGDPIPGARVEIWNATGSYTVGAGHSDDAGNYTVSGLVPGTYYAATDIDGGDYLDELYDNLPCSWPADCQPTTGTPIAVADGSTTTGIDFTLILGGAISGTVTDERSGDPVTSGEVRIINASGTTVGEGQIDSSGNYRVGGLETGTYYARTDLYYSSDWIEELYDDIPCPNGNCNPVTGTPIDVTLGDTVSGTDFALDRWGAITGTVTDAATGQPITSGEVEIYDQNDNYVDQAYLYSSGSFTVDRLAAGTYFARTRYVGGYSDELYEDLPCSSSCQPSTGTPIEVSLGATASGVNFALDELGAISGFVSFAPTGDLLPNIRVEVRSSNGNYVGGALYLASGDAQISSSRFSGNRANARCTRR